MRRSKLAQVLGDLTSSVPGPEADGLRQSAEHLLMQSLRTGGLREAERAIARVAETVVVVPEEHLRLRRAWQVRCGPRLSLSISVMCGDGLRSASVMFREEAAPRTTRQKEIAALQDAFYALYSRAARKAYEHGGRQSAADRVVVMIGELEADVNNGGFQQYLENKGVARARAALAALVAIGAKRTAHLLAAAVKLARDESALEGLDQQFYESAEDLPTRMMRYLAEASAGRCPTRR